MNRHFTQEDIWIQISTWQNAQHHYSSRNYILKPQWDAITHLLKWFKNIDNTNCWWGWRANRTLTPCGWESRMIQPLRKRACQCVIYLNIGLHLGSNNPTPTYLPKKNETYVHTKTGMNILATLFIIVENWKQLRCPSVGKWMNKPWCFHIEKC